MKLDEFKQIAIKESVNTNNDWGFGGKIGTYYKYKIKDVYFNCFCGKNYHRHTGTSSADYYYIDDEQVSRKKFINKLKDI